MPPRVAISELATSGTNSNADPPSAVEGPRRSPRLALRGRSRRADREVLVARQARRVHGGRESDENCGAEHAERNGRIRVQVPELQKLGPTTRPTMVEQITRRPGTSVSPIENTKPRAN